MAANPTQASTPPSWLEPHTDVAPPVTESEPTTGPAPPPDNPDQSAPDEPDRQQSLLDKSASLYQRRPFLVIALAVGAVILVVGLLAWWLYERQFESTDDAFIDGHAVQMAPKIAGYVTRLDIVDNELVHQGDVLLEIDPRDYQVALAAAKASEAAAASRLAQATAQIDAADDQARGSEADVAAAEATARNAEQDRERNSSLAPRGAVSQQTLDASVASARSTAAQVAAARARASAADSQAELARAQKATAEADLKQAQVEVARADLNLSYTKLIAPITGRVTHRTVELGDYLQPGQALFALVDPNVWVTANFKETQLTHMHVGQPVEVRVDAFPGQTLHAHVDSFQRGTGARFTLLPAENATGNYVKVVQRVPVKIVFDQPPPADMILGPGMSVEPTVTVR
ncbi:MAG TPA: HlyD family secretion protein [Pirellulales bacterium]|jgi:membrane fusion protein (multidrug efflux system)|nr:HlyD family secretion protein [Pirellulales bacterium]